MARFSVDHPEGAPARVAIAVRAPGQPVEAVARAAAEGPDAIPDGIPFSGWRLVTRDAPVSVSLQLPEGLPEAHDLVLVSTPDGPTVDYCWLKVSGIRVTRSLPGTGP
ncbi:DUF6212 domain-containing protein [Siccirubricoccus sp. G192]|uniref:DUF6212 domain-containing protein n=1 Tax=Siccirubricoccus sp. G192 TaxID=2849651 RepID=UPI0035C824E0